MSAATRVVTGPDNEMARDGGRASLGACQSSSAMPPARGPRDLRERARAVSSAPATARWLTSDRRGRVL